MRESRIHQNRPATGEITTARFVPRVWTNQPSGLGLPAGRALRWAFVSACACIAITACATGPVPQPTKSLVDTVWQLHAFQSMDDAQGTTRVADPRRFTLYFEAGGRANLTLDCNRGTGRWEATPTGDGTGTLRFGPIAATRALCPPPRLDERLVRGLAAVRSYRLLDGRLFMSLMADGGIYEWHPHRK